VLDASADPDHNRAVLTFAGPPAVVEECAVALAAMAVQAIDLRHHRGIHPRVGALDVLPLVPLFGLTMEDARASARRVGERLAREVGLPVYFYGDSSDPPGRGLAEIRKGGFEALQEGFPEGRQPDLLPDGWGHPGAHPTAGATCVGARALLLAWNIEVEGLTRDALEDLARSLRERSGGFPGLRALGFVRGAQAQMQISMNLEDVARRSPFAIFAAVEAGVRERGGRVVETEVVGMIPDRLLLEAGADRLALRGPGMERVLANRLLEHVAGRVATEMDRFAGSIRPHASHLPAEVREAVDRLFRAFSREGPLEPER
jgi:glutamate formiminotransferase